VHGGDAVSVGNIDIYENTNVVHINCGDEHGKQFELQITELKPDGLIMYDMKLKGKPDLIASASTLAELSGLLSDKAIYEVATQYTLGQLLTAKIAALNNKEGGCGATCDAKAGVLTRVLATLN
jgi:hypothetical protein